MARRLDSAEDRKATARRERRREGRWRERWRARLRRVVPTDASLAAHEGYSEEAIERIIDSLLLRRLRD